MRRGGVLAARPWLADWRTLRDAASYEYTTRNPLLYVFHSLEGLQGFSKARKKVQPCVVGGEQWWGGGGGNIATHTTTLLLAFWPPACSCKSKQTHSYFSSPDKQGCLVVRQGI
jgi:hypothetical protein